MSRKKTQQEYINQVAKINPDIIVLGVYNGNKKKIQHQCKICGHIWETQPLHIIQGHGCPECAKKQRPISKTMSHNDFAKRANILYPDIEIIGAYINTHHSIKVRCKKCGHIWSPKASTLLLSHDKHGGTGCKKCYTQTQIKNVKTFKEELSVKNPSVELLGDYINSYTKTLFKCLKCDKMCKWNTTPQIILTGAKSPMCNMSNGALAIKRFLDDHNIQYILEKTFNDCKNKQLLPFDFYLPDLHCCIEYDGEQHFNPINFNGCDNAKAQQSFEVTKKNDEIKNLYCSSNDIQLIRISFLQFKDINSILTNTLLMKEGDAK